MKLIRCPYCGAEFNKHHIEYVGADPQMQIITGLLFIFFAINTLLVHRYFEETGFLLLMSTQLVLGGAVTVRGIYKFVRGRRDFLGDVKRHLSGHRHGSRSQGRHRRHSRPESQLQTAPTPQNPSTGAEAK